MSKWLCHETSEFEGTDEIKGKTDNDTLFWGQT